MPARQPSLVARDLVRIRGGRRILDGVAFTASPGQRIGLIGENGAGKTTLLRVLAGLDVPESGEITRPARIGILHQEPVFPATVSITDVVDAALAPSRELLDRLERLAADVAADPGDPQIAAAYAGALQEAEVTDAWDAARRADRVLTDLGLAGIDREREVGTLSGGERSRLALAALLVTQPDALLLDEPTNHLDGGALDALEHHLRSVPGVVVAASHDRVFLDAVCTHLVDLDPARDGATRYTGAYTSYLDAKRAERARWEQAHAEHLDEIAALQRAIAVTARRVAPGRPMRDRNKPAYDRHAGRVQASISSRVRIARHRLDEVHRNPVPAPPPPLRFRAAVGAAAGDGTPPDGTGEHRPLVVAQPAVVPGRLDLGRVEIASRDRLLVTGSNGAGKSTLLELLASPAAWHAAGVRVGLLPQEATFENPRLSPEQIYSKAVWRPADDDAAGDGVPALAGLGLFPAADLHRPVAHLSTGQRRRLALAVLIASAPHVVLLDEPTNHLSLSLVEELENALRSAPAAVVIATHDRWLRRRWEGRELSLECGRALAPTSPD